MILQATFDTRVSAIVAAINKVQDTVGRPAEVQFRAEEGQRNPKVIGVAHDVMMVIGAVADQGEDGLLSVVPA